MKTMKTQINGNYLPLPVGKLITIPFNWTGLTAVQLCRAGVIDKKEIVTSLTNDALPFHQDRFGSIEEGGVKYWTMARNSFAYEMEKLLDSML